MIIIAFENAIFPLPCQYPTGMDDWKEDEMNHSSFLKKKNLAFHYDHFSIKSGHKKTKNKC